jgi:hypothetical protein
MSVERSQHEDAGRGVFLPARVQVVEVLQSRYSDPKRAASIVESQWYVPGVSRPLSWDERTDGIDVVRIASGEILKLSSSGMQSVPKPGWVLMLTGGDADEGYRWTLYGIPPKM